jgi:hypothetical protein
MDTQQLLATPRGRRILSAASPQFFDAYYCGMRRADHRDRWLDTMEGATVRAKDTGVKAKTLILAPRDHGKTEAAITYATRALCLDRDIRILWISESQGQAEKRMRRVSSLLQSSRILEDWASDPLDGAPPFQAEGSKWTNNLIYLNRSRQSVDASLEVIGAGMVARYGRADALARWINTRDRYTQTPR